MGVSGFGNAYAMRYKQSITAKKQYTPHGHTNVTRTVVIKQQAAPAPMMPMHHGPMMPAQPKTNWFGVIAGGVLGFFTSWAGNKAASNSQSNYGYLNSTNNTTNTVNSGQSKSDLDNLKALFPKHNIVESNGKFYATDANGQVYGPGTFDEMCNLLGNAGTTDEPSKTDQTGKTDTTGTTGTTGTNGTNGTTDGQGSNAWTNAAAGDIDNYSGNMMVHDEVLGSKADINGECTISSEKNDDGFPKTITVKGYKYEYTEIKDRAALYKSQDGKGDVYRLEKKGNSFALNQYKGDQGAGTADNPSKKYRFSGGGDS